MNVSDFRNIPHNRTVRHICLACVEMLEQYNLNDVTPQLIAKSAEISKSTFYRYFTDKYSLINYIYFQYVERMNKYLVVLDTYLEANIALYDEWNKYNNFFRNAGSTRGSESLYNFKKSYWINFYIKEWCKCFGEENLTDSIRRIITVWSAGVTDIVFEWINKSQIDRTTSHGMSTTTMDTIPSEIKAILEYNAKIEGHPTKVVREPLIPNRNWKSAD